MDKGHTKTLSAIWARTSALQHQNKRRQRRQQREWHHEIQVGEGVAQVKSAALYPIQRAVSPTHDIVPHKVPQCDLLARITHQSRLVSIECTNFRQGHQQARPVLKSIWRSTHRPLPIKQSICHHQRHKGQQQRGNGSPERPREWSCKQNVESKGQECNACAAREHTVTLTRRARKTYKHKLIVGSS